MDWDKLYELVDVDVVFGMKELIRQHLAEYHGAKPERCLCDHPCHTFDPGLYGSHPGDDQPWEEWAYCARCGKPLPMKEE